MKTSFALSFFLAVIASVSGLEASEKQGEKRVAMHLVSVAPPFWSRVRITLTIATFRTLVATVTAPDTAALVGGATTMETVGSAKVSDRVLNELDLGYANGLSVVER